MNIKREKEREREIRQSKRNEKLYLDLLLFLVILSTVRKLTHNCVQRLSLANQTVVTRWLGEKVSVLG
jgi:hypothetical protein